MRGRTFRVALLLFEALWLNVVVPGHQRGVVAVPGDRCAACRADLDAHSTCTSGGRRPHDTPPGTPDDPVEHCAICHFAAMLTVPLAVDFTPPALGLLELLPHPLAEAPFAAAFQATYLSRGPPA